jgi:hypothetical protein
MAMLVTARGVLIAGLCIVLSSPALGDEAGDLEDLVEAGSEFNGDQQELDQLVKQHRDGSRKLRAQSDEDLSRLITAICGNDIEPEENYGTDIALRLADETSSNFRNVYGALEDSAEDVLEEIEDFLNEMKSTRDRYRSLADSSDPNIKEKAKAVLDDIGAKVEAATTSYGEVQADLQTAKNVADGVMQGANHPKIRAAMEYGKTKHRDMQSSLSCDDKEVVLPSGQRADCVKFDANNCTVIEIKPDAADMSKADDQVRAYAEELKRFYTGSDAKSTLAKERCEKDSNGDLLFKRRIETYSACKSTSF